MLINGIEYNIRLYVDDEETEEEITEELFEDFEQMNAFLEKTWLLPEYANAKAEYVFVEVVNGNPDNAGRYGYELDGYMPMDQEEINDVLFDMEVSVPQDQEEFQAMAEEHQMFHPGVEQGMAGDASKDIPLSEYVYLCPGCLNEVNECTCPGYPYYLIQIDRLMAPVIRELNKKGYQTTSCCAGHPEYKEICGRQLVYISFRQPYLFAASLPENYVYRKEGNSLCFDIPEEGKKWDRQDLKEYQKNCLEKLLAWAEALPII